MHAVAVGWYWSFVQILDIEKSRSWREAKIHTEDAHPRNSKCLRFFDQYTNISMETVTRKTYLTGTCETSVYSIIFGDSWRQKVVSVFGFGRPKSHFLAPENGQF